METNVGLSQVNKPAPLWYRRLTNAIILSFVPAYVGIVQGVPMPDDKRNVLMVIGAAIPFLFKGVGMILGNGEYIQPSKEDK
jgi:hypothetical protein